jgi:hypothetical protein
LEQFAALEASLSQQEEHAMSCRLELKKDREARFFFTLRAVDGTELLHGPPSYSRADTRRRAAQVARCLAHDEFVTRHEAHGEFYFVLRNEREELVARSRHMKGPLALQEILDEARRSAPDTELIDSTR